MAKRDQDVHFLASKEEVERIHEKMDELGIRSMGAYLRKMALDGYCIRLDLQDVKALVSLLRICSNNLNQYAKRANETGSIYRADITVIGFACRRSGLNVSSFPSAVFPFVNIFSFSCHKVHLLQYDYNSDGKL